MNFNEERERKVQEIEKILEYYLPVEEGQQKKIMEAMKYNVMAGGKRLRPMLMQETYTMFGGTSRIIEPFMAALEMIHTYSLVHDDLPSMDNDDYRRGRKTTHIVYGEGMAVLTGDALLNYAFETAAKAFDMEPERSLVIGKALQVLGKKAGIYGMIGGQVVDVESVGKQIDRDVITFIYSLKTCALIEAAMMVGAILSGASEEEIRKVESIAWKVGMAFQIQDDILDVIGDEQTLGKPVGSDERNEKTTYVSIHGLENAKAKVKQYTEQSIELLQAFDGDKEFLTGLMTWMIDRDK